MLEKESYNTLFRVVFFSSKFVLVGTHLGSNATPPLHSNSTHPESDGQRPFGLPVFTGVPHLFYIIFSFSLLFFFIFDNLVPQKLFLLILQHMEILAHRH